MKRIGLIRLIVVLAIVVAGAVWWHGINVTTDVVVPTPAMPKPNAFDFFTKAVDLEVREGDIDSAIATTPIQNFSIVHGEVRVTTTAPHTFTLAQQEAMVSANAPAIAEMRKGFAYPYMSPPVRSNYTTMPYEAKFRALARLMFLAGEVEEAKGDSAGAARDYIDAIQYGEKLPHESVSIGRMVGVACAAIGRKRLWALADHLSASEARSAAQRLSTICADEDPLPDTFVQEKWTQMAIMEEALLKPGYPASVMDEFVGPAGATIPAATRDLYLAEGRVTAKRKLLHDTASYWDAVIRRSREPQPMRTTFPALPANFLNLLVSAAGGPADLKGVVVKTLDDQAQNALLATTFALKAYRLDHGSYPPSLTQLVPTYLRAVPSDPFAASGPVRYKREGTSYVLYSVGPDGNDDGGKPIYSATWRGGSPLRGEQRYFTDMDSKGDIVAGVNVY